MSDLPNGLPPGQNNLDAGAPAYVPPENDPSTNVPKDDSTEGTLEAAKAEVDEEKPKPKVDEKPGTAASRK